MQFDARLPPITVEEASRLVALYSDAEADIQMAIERGLSRGNDLTYLNRMKTNVRAIIVDLNHGSLEWCRRAVPELYQVGLDFGEADLRDLLKDLGDRVLPKGKILGGFGAIHQQASKVLAENIYSRLQNVHMLIGRRVDDIYRRMALESTRGSIVGYQTWRQSARTFLEELHQRGVTAFTDRGGRRWNMKVYAEVVARQTTAEAHWTGTENRLLENGFDLVIVSDHNNPCERCGPWERRVISMTGQTPGYPTMAEAMAKGFRHVKCRHAFGAYVPELHAALVRPAS